MLTLPTLFSDHGVLQHSQPLPIWGCAKPGSTVRVTLGGHSAETIATADGAFHVTLPALPPGGPHELVVHAAGTTVRATDLMIGEVWLCSGQSNMEWSMKATPDTAPDLATADFPLIRLTTVPSVLPAQPASAWVRCTPATAEAFSAVAFGLGREIHRAIGHAVGLISAAWGGTKIDAWTPTGSLASDDDGRAVLAAYRERADAPEAKARTAAWKPLDWAAWEDANRARDPGDTGSARGWAASACDDSAWPRMTLPSLWQDHGITGSAVIWFRRSVEIPAAWRGRELRLEIGACDKHDHTFVNGELVGSIGFENPNAWCTPRVYKVPKNLMGGTQVTIAVRVFSYLYNGGMSGPGAIMRLAPALAAVGDGAAIPLAGDWAYRIEHDFGFIQPPPPAPAGPFDPDRPGGLWDAKIAPLVPVALAGIAWYQGESDVHQAQLYRDRMLRMIRAWRAAWQREIPFAFVQISSFASRLDSATASPWADLRAAQTEALSEAATMMATAIDLGEQYNIHPGGKLEVGRRLAAAWRHHAGFIGEPGGPVCSACNADGDALKLSFTGAGGWVLSGGGFDIAGEDGVFVPATARRDGDVLILKSPSVPHPCRARYAYADFPELGLWGANGSPALPFRITAHATQDGSAHPGAALPAGKTSAKPHSAASRSC